MQGGPQSVLMNGEPQNNARRAPFFVLGAPRSGTSLLSRMLNSHPAVAVPDETKIFETFVPLMPLYGDLRQPARLIRLVEDVLRWRWMRRLPHLPATEAVLNRVASPDLGGVFAALLGLWAENQGKQCWGEKSPNHLYYWPDIEAAFPEASLIHIVRDGRDVAMSLIKAPFGPKTMAMAAERWVGFVEMIRAIGRRLGPGRYVEICYEQLLAQPQETITRVLELIGQPFDPAVMQFHVGARAVATDPVNDANIQKPLQPDNAGKWRQQLSLKEIEIFEGIGGETLLACGYPRGTTAAPMGSAERLMRRYLQHLPPKVAAMMRNSEGIAEGIERQRIRWHLLADRWTGKA